VILIALGANLPSRFGHPPETLKAALRALEQRGVRIVRASRIWQSAPLPVSDQPDYSNAAAAVETALEPCALLTVLREVERAFGREEAPRNAARLLDLDLLAYDETVQDDAVLTLPHPRLQERGFVLYPLREVAPDWIHPVLGKTPSALIEALPADQKLDSGNNAPCIKAAG
jgi:2-amino-4-hydroxy-6-hydroxymethyldihydropteridine diphosphokinase